jgi:ABC-type multidrug transport system fused ATPase/permease subunit
VLHWSFGPLSGEAEQSIARLNGRSVSSGGKSGMNELVEMIARLSPITADAFLLSLLLALVFFVAVPLGVTFYLRYERRRRRKLVDSPRKIGLATDEAEERICEHLRSKSRARQTSAGDYVSICKKCGVAMKRNGPGNWVATE